MACLPDGGQEEGEGAEGGGWASQEELVGWGVLPQGLQLGSDEGQGGLQGLPRWRVQIARPQLAATDDVSTEAEQAGKQNSVLLRGLR